MPERFEQVLLPHLDAVYSLARWLIRSPADAEDVVQEAYLRALQFFDGFRGGRQPRLAFEDRAQYLLFVGKEESPRLNSPTNSMKRFIAAKA